MFPFITCTWNPITGCLHDCVYCWARKLAETKLKGTSRYKDGFKPTFHEEELKRNFKQNDFVFVSDMGDAFGSWINQDWQEKVFRKINENPETDFLLMTKNPMAYYWLQNLIPRNCILGCTIESNAIYNLKSKAPWQPERLKTMQKLVGDPMLPNRRFIAVEPLMDFHLDLFLDGLLKTKPWGVAIGYDNYGNHLSEPSLDKTNQLIAKLEANNVKVFRKTIREKRP
jgi:protein gp37